MSARMDRRDFVRFVTGGAVGAAASGVSLRGISRFNTAIDPEEVRVPGGREAWALSACSLCEAGCGLNVRTIGNRVVKIQGNPMHPVNHGGLCPKGLAGLQALYHPDRLRTPLKNVGSRRTPRWREISWEEAVPMVTRKLRELRDAGKAHTVAIVDQSRRNLSSRLLARFLTAYGSPNYLTMPSGLDAVQTALYLQQGVTREAAYDWENTRYLLSFGVNLLEGWGSPATIMRAFGRWRDSSAGRRTKFVQIGSRFSMTAAKADEWISLRPGMEASLALGMAYVLITEELFDAAFVRDHTFGFDDWRDAEGKAHMGFRSLVLSDYRLDDVSAATGVPAEKILRIAREFAVNRPALAIGDQQTSTLAGDPYAAMAVHSLNAMVGSVDAAGGVLLQADLPLPEQKAVPGWPRLDESLDHVFPRWHLTRLPEAIVSRKPYPLNALLLNDADPVFSLPNGDAFRRALHEVPFIATFTSFFNDSAALSDVILPAPTGLERWQANSAPPGFAQALLSLSQPVIPPRHRTREAGDVLLEVARGLRGPVAEALPFAGLEEFLKREIAAVVKTQHGVAFSSSFEETWNRMLERSGWWAPSYSNAEDLWGEMRKKGGWWEPAYAFGDWERVFATPSRRFEFYSQKLAQWAKAHPGMDPHDDRLFLPHQPALENAPKGELLLAPIEVLPLSGGSGAHLPYLQQIAGAHLEASWDSWLEIHPETAKKLGIADGEWVWVESRRGRAKVRARLYAGAHPDMVYLPLGYGHIEGSEWSRRGTNPLRLLEPRSEPVGGLPQSWSTYVKVSRG